MSTSTSVDAAVVVSAAAGAIVALVFTLLLVPLTSHLARRLGVIDEPGARSSHEIPTPRLGGIGVAVGALAGLATAAALVPTALDRAVPGSLSLGFVLGVTAVLFGCIGLADDLLRGIPVSVRLALQLVVGSVMVVPWVIAELTHDAAPSTVVIVLPGAVGVMWVIGYLNAFNFMDGVDGMSGFVAVVVGLDLALVGGLDDQVPLVVAGLVLVGAAAGFLPHNLHTPTVFLGDGGSYFLGAWIGVAAVVGIRLDTPPEAVLAVTAPYAADTATTLLRRVARRADWRLSHHEHAYQQLVDQGRSHLFVSAIVAGVSALCAALGLVSLFAGPVPRAGAAVAVVGVVAAYLASPMVLGRHRPVVLSLARAPGQPAGNAAPTVRPQTEQPTTAPVGR